MKKAYVFVHEKGTKGKAVSFTHLLLRFQNEKKYPAQAYNSQGRTKEKRRLKAITEILNTYGKS
jgi:hypothetical protein